RTDGERGLSRAAGLVDGGEPAHCRARLLGAAPPRVRQHRGQQRGLAGRERAHRLVERVAAAGLCAELPVRTPFSDVEVDFEHTPFGQYEIDPYPQPYLQCLAQETAPSP